MEECLHIVVWDIKWRPGGYAPMMNLEYEGPFVAEYDYNSTRILIVADDSLARSGLAAELSGVPGMAVVAKMPSLDVAAAIEAYNRLLEQNPDNDYIKSQLEWLRSQ